MSKIDDKNSYNIEDLVKVWKSGWQYLAEYANRQYPYELSGSGDKSKPYLERAVAVIDDVLCPYVGMGKHINAPKSCLSHIELLNLAASDSKNPYSPVVKTIYVGPVIIGLFSSSKGIPQEHYMEQLGDWSKNKKKLKTAIKKLTSAFAQGGKINEIILKLANEQNIQRFKDIWSNPKFHKSILHNYYRNEWANIENSNEQVNSTVSQIMWHLNAGINSADAFEEAWWNCLWTFIKQTVDNFLEIKRRINDDEPIDTWQIELINYFLAYGCPAIDIRSDNKAYKPQTVLKPKEAELKRLLISSPFVIINIALLVQPAFDLAQQLRDSFRKGRFITQCRAPSCGKRFYTGRKNATNCPGSKGNKKNKCSLEWIRYKRWLDKTGRNSEKCWQDTKFQSDFISYDQQT